MLFSSGELKPPSKPLTLKVTVPKGSTEPAQDVENATFTITLTASTVSASTVNIPSGATVMLCKVEMTPSYSQAQSGYITTGSTLGTEVIRQMGFPVYSLN